MKRVCSWCKKELGYVKSNLEDKQAVTHGICKECAIKVVSQIASLELGRSKTNRISQSSS